VVLQTEFWFYFVRFSDSNSHISSVGDLNGTQPTNSHAGQPTDDVCGCVDGAAAVVLRDMRRAAAAMRLLDAETGLKSSKFRA
jgi:hypothetical protein